MACPVVNIFFLERHWDSHWDFILIYSFSFDYVSLWVISKLNFVVSNIQIDSVPGTRLNYTLSLLQVEGEWSEALVD